MAWFEQLMGFRESDPDTVRRNIVLQGDCLRSTVNDRLCRFGQLEIPSLGALRSQYAQSGKNMGRTQVSERVADVQQLHRDPANRQALFQVASQFNLLEMVGPEVTPEHGVSGYAYDLTQGPACAVAAGAGTIYRNYFHPVQGKPGQSSRRQIDCLADLGQALGNEADRLWSMRNGYALPTAAGLRAVDQHLGALDEDGLDVLRQLLRVGIQRHTEVTLGDAGHEVTQVYCSALPVAYSRLPAAQWVRFACLVLEAAYEATLLAGVSNAALTGNSQVYLTLLGGGAFGNQKSWILAAMQRALHGYQDAGLSVTIVSYRRSDPDVQDMIRGFAAR